MEEAATEILKNQISSIETWIGEQQAKYYEEKERIDKAYEENRKSLLSTGSFTEIEVKDHLINIQKKSEEKQAVYDQYADLLSRCQNIYKWADSSQNIKYFMKVNLNNQIMLNLPISKVDLYYAI